MKRKRQAIPSPLPMRDGVSASRTWLPKPGSSKNATEFHGSWDTILAFLIDRFPFIPEAVFHDRLARGDIVNERGEAYRADSPYVADSFLFYYREIPQEATIPFKETVLHKDDHLIVVDKPHFLPVTPTGRFVKESLLSRLKHRYQVEDISPIHRLDRETAGVMLFSLNKTMRAGYQQLFQERQVNKQYEAIAAHSSRRFPYTHRSHLTAGEPFFRMQEVNATPNTETIMEIIESKDGLARYLLKPVTGKQHQLRVHMAAIGCPILNDPFYPSLLPSKEDDYSQPLQLLAKRIEFEDPITGDRRCFESQQHLQL